jgi:UDP-galactopyranose mutase
VGILELQGGITLDDKVDIFDKRDHVGGNVYDEKAFGIIVQKYGGSSVGTPEKIKNVANTIPLK